MGVSYLVELSCLFEDIVLPCGQSSISSERPLLVNEESEAKPVTMFVESTSPESWDILEGRCRSSGGHLVSLEHQDIEESITSMTNLTDFWSGGNICRDSPGIQTRITTRAQSDRLILKDGYYYYYHRIPYFSSTCQ